MLTLAVAKSQFFDRKAVRDQVGRAKAAAFARAASFVWTRAKRSIRKRKKASKPGQPPSSHEGSLRRLYLFAFDPRTESAVVGPAAFGKGVVPELLEYGGKGEVREYQLSGGRWVKGGNPLLKGNRLGRSQRVRKYRIAARPSAAPALAAERANIAMQFRDAVGRK